MMASRHDGTYLYILQYRSGTNVYKVGFTTNFSQRMGGYPKDSIVMLSMRILDGSVIGRAAENVVLTTFKSCFKHRPDIGREYFEGSISDMTGMLANIASVSCFAPLGKKKENKIESTTVDEDPEMEVDTDDNEARTEESHLTPVSTPHPVVRDPRPDAMKIVLDFVRPRLTTLSGMNVSVDELFNELQAEAGHLHACPRLKPFVTLVCKMFHAKCHGIEITFPCTVTPNENPLIDPKTVQPEVAIATFFETHCCQLSGPVKTLDMFKAFNGSEYAVAVPMRAFVNIMKTLFGITVKMHAFPGGACQAMLFKSTDDLHEQSPRVIDNGNCDEQNSISDLHKLTMSDLPRGCIVNDSDPRLETIRRFVDEHITSELVRRPDQRGRKVLGFLRRDDIVSRIRSSSEGLFHDIKVSLIKDLVSSVMATRGLKLCAKTNIEGEQVCNVFPGCEWRTKL